MSRKYKNSGKARRSCKDKVRFEDQASAEWAGSKHGVLRAYPCRHCKGWHLSSKSDTAAR